MHGIFFLICFCSLMAADKPQFKDWQSQIKLNDTVFESEAHNAYIDIYANALAAPFYRARSVSFPVGSVLYKPLYYSAKKEEIALLVIMKKMASGYDVKHNDWWYGVYDATGSEAYHTGRVKSCIACHQQASKTDYMFSPSVMDHIEKGKAIKAVLPH